MFLSIQFKLSVQLSNMNIAGPDLVELDWGGGGGVDGSCCHPGSQAGTALSWRNPFWRTRAWAGAGKHSRASSHWPVHC